MFRPSIPYRKIAAHLKGGGLIAYPTESCYGLGCNPSNRAAVHRILQLKQRPQHKGLILIAANYQQVAAYIEPLTLDQQQHLSDAGKQVVTYLMPSHAPRWLRGKHNSLAIRLTGFHSAADLCRGINSALVSTSANHSGKRSIKTYAECLRIFGKQVLVLPGKVGKRKKPSTIRRWMDETVIRS